MLLWNYEEIKAGWAWAKPSNLRKLFMLKTYKFWQNQETPEVRLARKEADPSLDPHYKLMLRNLYPEVRFCASPRNRSQLTSIVDSIGTAFVFPTDIYRLTSSSLVVVGCCCGHRVGSWIGLSLRHGLDTTL
jgi:hypothetical protein